VLFGLRTLSFGHRSPGAWWSQSCKPTTLLSINITVILFVVYISIATISDSTLRDGEEHAIYRCMHVSDDK
jgi:hypothetical protein